MKRKIISVLLAVMMLFSVIQMSFAASAQNGLSIPDGAVITKAPSEELQINFWLADGVPYYSVLYRGTELIEPSAMGLSLSTGELSSGFTVENVSSSTANDSWSPVAGEKDVIIDSYNQNAVKISQESGQTLTVEMRAYDTGVAFRYILPEGSYTVNSEYTQYKIPGGTSADVHVGGNQTVPRSVNVENFSGTYRSPMTLEYPQGYVVTLCEANIDNYAPLRLQTVEPRVLRAVYGNGGDTVTVENSDPAATPWSTFVVGATLERLPENSDIILNLNEAPEGDFSWVKPGKNIMTSGNNTTESMKEWIDCAKEQNYDYVLIDTGWYGPEWDDRCDPRLDPEALNDGSELSELLKKYIVGDGHFKHPGFPMYGKLEEEGTMVVDLNMPEVCEYAKSQGIGIILYVEDRALFDTRGRYTVDELLSRFASWGASGIKPGVCPVSDAGASETARRDDSYCGKI